MIKSSFMLNDNKLDVIREANSMNRPIHNSSSSLLLKLEETKQGDTRQGKEGHAKKGIRGAQLAPPRGGFKVSRQMSNC